MGLIISFLAGPKTDQFQRGFNAALRRLYKAYFFVDEWADFVRLQITVWVIMIVAGVVRADITCTGLWRTQTGHQIYSFLRFVLRRICVSRLTHLYSIVCHWLFLLFRLPSIIYHSFLPSIPYFVPSKSCFSYEASACSSPGIY